MKTFIVKHADMNNCNTTTVLQWLSIIPKINAPNISHDTCHTKVNLWQLSYGKATINKHFMIILNDLLLQQKTCLQMQSKVANVIPQANIRYLCDY